MRRLLGWRVLLVGALFFSLVRGAWVSVKTGVAEPVESAESGVVEGREPEAAAVGAGAEAAAEAEAGAEAEAEAEKTYDEAYVKALRDEAASYRRRLREAEDRLSSAKTVGEYESAVGEFREQNAELLRKLVAAEHGLPAELADRLRGSNEEELRADAESLAKFAAAAEAAPAPVPPSREGGGLGGAGAGGEALPTDPGELAALLRPKRFLL